MNALRRAPPGREARGSSSARGPSLRATSAPDRSKGPVDFAVLRPRLPARRRRFVQLDVFRSRPFLGNPLAVVVDGEGLDTAEMQRFARWTNLSETTFLLPPDDPRADYRVRIFTPSEELPFAGHPTLGSAQAWLDHGVSPRRDDQLLQECGVGLVPIRRDARGLAFAAPTLRRGGPVAEPILREAADALGLARAAVVDAAWADNGPGWIALWLGSAAEVLAIRPRSTRLSMGVAGPCPPGSPFDYEARAFHSSGGATIEDPVTGSLHAALAQWLVGSGRFAEPYLASQGAAVGHAGVVRIDADASGDVWVGGDVATCIAGTVDL